VVIGKTPISLQIQNKQSDMKNVYVCHHIQQLYTVKDRIFLPHPALHTVM